MAKKSKSLELLNQSLMPYEVFNDFWGKNIEGAENKKDKLQPH